MIYKYNYGKGTLSSFIIITLLILVQICLFFIWPINKFWPLILYFCIYSICNLVLIFVHYELQILEDKLIYKIYFWKYTLKTIIIEPDSIKKVVFRRVHWKDKGVKIKFSKGLFLQFFRYEPTGIEMDLQRFCEENNVPYKKTKDFLLLEKYY